MKNKILARLSDADDFVSGQQLCDEFGVSRTAVWKAVNRLKKEGYIIESVTNRGYRLKDGCDILSESEISRFLNTDIIGKKVVVYDECDSTNSCVARDSQTETEEGLVVVANRQTSGKGRRGRVWESPAGTSVYMSMLLRPKLPPGPAPQITLVTGLAVSDAIDELIRENSSDGKNRQQAAGTDEIRTLIKWPNDIVMGKKKICGILTELDCQIDFINNIVVGIGINVSGTTFPDDIADKAGSILSVAGVSVNRNRLVAAVCNRFEEYYKIFLKTGTIEKLVEKYDDKLINKDCEVRVLDPKGEYNGVAKGIAADGRLIVETADGTEFVSSGEVSVRGLYGYV